MGRERPAVLVAVLLCGAGVPLGVAGERSGPRSTELLARGIQQVENREFGAGLATLEAFVRESDPTAVKPLVKAYVYMGGAYLGLGDRRGAVAVFGAALDLDRGLRLRAPGFSPEVVAVFNDLRARREASSRPARQEARRRAAGKVAVGAGVIAAVGGAGAVLSNGSSGEPELMVQRTSFDPTLLTCPDGASGFVLPILIEVDLRAGPRPVAFYEALVRLEVVGNVSPHRAQSSIRPTVISPLSAEAGEEAVVLLRSSLACANSTGDERVLVQWRADVTLRTSGGVVRSATENLLQVDHP